MEYMDKGSFDSIYKKIGPIDIDIVGVVALSVLEGLTYLYNTHKIIHRGATMCAIEGYNGDGKLTRHQISSPPTSYATRREPSSFVTLASLANSSTPLRKHLSEHPST